MRKQRGRKTEKMVLLKKEEYEGKPLLKPYNKKTNPTGVKEGEIMTVKTVEKITLPQTGDSWTMIFHQHPESLALNKTNLKMMVKLFGDDTDDWVKQRVKLIVVMANNPKGGGEVPSIRIKRKDWQYGDDEGEDIPDKDANEQPDEPTGDDLEAEVKKIQERRKK